MTLPSVKSVLPRSLFGRALLILLVPIVALQLLVGLVFFQRHYQRVTEQMTRSVALELRFAIEQLETAGSPELAAERLAEIARPLNLVLTLAPDEPLMPGVTRTAFDVTGQALAETLRREIGRPLRIDLTANNIARIGIPTKLGALEAVVPRPRLTVSNPHQLLVLMLLASAILTATAVIFLRNQVRPIRALAEAAEAFGKGRALAFRPAGAEEVRRAGAAFLSMRGRIERQIEQRTRMLSGVSHDLRTPLTRMKLSLALLDESEEVRDMRQDVEQMERMVGEFLAFTRGDSLEETAPVDPFALATEIVENARRAGSEIALSEVNETPGDVLVPMRSGSVRRAVENLVGNAARHGTRVSMQVRLLPKTLDFVVEDDGPGIPEADRDRALQPFARLDAARNQDQGGSVGLGLSIAVDVARSHGGNLELGTSTALGGLRTVLRLPR